MKLKIRKKVKINILRATKRHKKENKRQDSTGEKKREEEEKGEIKEVLAVIGQIWDQDR